MTFTRDTAYQAKDEIQGHADAYLNRARIGEKSIEINTEVKEPPPLFPEDGFIVSVNVNVKFDAGVIYEAYNHDEESDNMFEGYDQEPVDKIMGFRANLTGPSEVPRAKAHLTLLLDLHFASDDE